MPDTGGALRSAPTELGLEEYGTGLCLGHGLYGLFSSWLDALRILPPNSIEILVGIGPTDYPGRFERLTEAITQCNQVLVDRDINRAYDVRGDEGTHVAHIHTGTRS